MRPAAHDGFTLIELLTAMLVIAILAAIAIPAFLSQRGRAQDTDAKVGVRSAQTALEMRYTSAQTYVSTAGDLIEAEPSLAEARGLAVQASDNSLVS